MAEADGVLPYGLRDRRTAQFFLLSSGKVKTRRREKNIIINQPDIKDTRENLSDLSSKFAKSYPSQKKNTKKYSIKRGLPFQHFILPFAQI